MTAADISRGPAGVRAQAMTAGGDLVGDFIFSKGEGELGARSENKMLREAKKSIKITHLKLKLITFGSHDLHIFYRSFWQQGQEKCSEEY